MFERNSAEALAVLTGWLDRVLTPSTAPSTATSTTRSPA
jgi:hypothetical protein